MKKLKTFGWWKLLLLFTVVIVSCSQKDSQQTGYTIEIESPILKNDTLVLTRYSLSENRYHDTLKLATMNNGAITIKGYTPEPCIARLRFPERKKSLSFILDNSDIKITVRPENLLDGSMKGTQIESNGIQGILEEKLEQAPEYNSSMIRFLGLSAESKRLYENKTDTALFKMVRRLKDKAWFEIIYAQRAVYKAIVDSTSDLQLALLIQMNDRFYDNINKDSLLNAYIAAYGEDYNIQLYRNREKRAMEFRQKAKQLDIGKKILDFQSDDINGKTYKLSEVVAKNKVVLLEFWASWCSPCRAEIPNLKENYKKYHSKGFEIFAFSVDHSKKAWVKASEETQIPYINTSELKAPKEGTISKLYEIDKSGVPMNLLIDSDGTIIAKDIKGKQLNDTLAEVLQ